MAGVSIPTHRIPAHPGAILREEFLVPLGRTAVELAAHLGLSEGPIENLVAEKSSMTAELAWALSMAFDTTPEFWLNLQVAHDLAASRPTARIPTLPTL